VKKFNKGSKVKISIKSPSFLQFVGQTGIIDRNPTRDTFRFWYLVRISGLMRRFAEEEIEELRN
jgi:hypothetical protein